MTSWKDTSEIDREPYDPLGGHLIFGEASGSQGCPAIRLLDAMNRLGVLRMPVCDQGTAPLSIVCLPPLHQVAKARSDQDSSDDPLDQGKRTLVGIVFREIKEEEEGQDTSDDQRQGQQKAVTGTLHEASYL